MGKKTQLYEYAPGRTYSEGTTLTGSYEDLYAGKGHLVGGKGSGAYDWLVDVDQSMINLTGEQQTAIANNKNMKETQKRLKNQGVGQQQTVMGGGGY